MKYKKDDLTNEQLKGRYTSQFDLANRAIEIAQDEIAHGMETSLNHILNQLSEIPLQDESNQEEQE